MSDAPKGDEMSYAIQASALYVLEAFCTWRGKHGEVLAALSASANHGVLMFMLHQVIGSLENGLNQHPFDFVEALFSLVATII